MANPETLLPPGFRFHPTDEELIQHYLRNQATSLPCPVSIIAEVDIYKFDPGNSLAMFGDKEWYFFSPRDRKYPNGVRPNRAAASGYWKATGTDKPIVADGGAARRENIGVKKALVFYQGRPPKGIKTDWIMHEYRLVDGAGGRHHGGLKRPRDSSMRLDDWVLCRIYKKSNNQQPSLPSDRDQEASTVEDTYFPPSHSGGGGGGGRLPKNASLSDLFNDADFSVLARLLHENPSDMRAPELDQYLDGGGIFSLLTAEESPPKRQRTAADQGGPTAAAFDRYDGHCTGAGDGEDATSLPCNQHRLLNSHLELLR
ncbi:unnamed protein product [Spirodela intermedia]|uniref:NAC domain-containing protein n=1 Tax=Spirodela intermedia TaxID=51605 RepID=A0A7I8IW77_SPIIN|nr:unnamed protein product [Spirodela intermedia]CAA6661913.1 unnamed protein product [Spirodela intermedia]